MGDYFSPFVFLIMPVREQQAGVSDTEVKISPVAFL